MELLDLTNMLDSLELVLLWDLLELLLEDLLELLLELRLMELELRSAPLLEELNHSSRSVWRQPPP